MPQRLDKILGIFCFSICTVTTALLFIPETGDLYFSFGRYLLCVAFAFGLAAIVLFWYRSIKLAGWKNHIQALIKSVALVGVFSFAYIILAVSHSGI